MSHVRICQCWIQTSIRNNYNEYCDLMWTKLMKIHFLPVKIKMIFVTSSNRIMAPRVNTLSALDNQGSHTLIYSFTSCASLLPPVK